MKCLKFKMRTIYLVHYLALVIVVCIPNVKCGQETSRAGKGKSGKGKGAATTYAMSGGERIRVGQLSTNLVVGGEASSSAAPAYTGASASLYPDGTEEALPAYDHPPEYDAPQYDNNSPSDVNLYDYIYGSIEFGDDSLAKVQGKCDDLPGWVPLEKTCVKGREKKKSLTICTRQIVRIIKEDKNQKKLFNSFEVLLPQSDSKLKFAQYTTKTMKVTLLPKNGDETTPKKKVTVAIFEWEFPEKEFDKKEKELMAEIVKHKATICQP